MESNRIINHCLLNLNILLFIIGCLGYLCPISAQQNVIDSTTNVRIKILTYNVGFTGTFNRSINGESAWRTGDSKDATGFINTFQYMYFSPKKTIGYGIQLYGYTRNKKHFIDDNYLKERINIIYIAPQFAYLKRETAFKHCFGIVGGGIGYLNYSSKEKLITGKNCKAQSSNVGIHANLGYEYLFAKDWGARLEVGCLFSPINLHYNNIPEDFPFKARNKFGLCLMNIQIGISSHF